MEGRNPAVCRLLCTDFGGVEMVGFMCWISERNQSFMQVAALSTRERVPWHMQTMGNKKCICAIDTFWSITTPVLGQNQGYSGCV